MKKIIIALLAIALLNTTPVFAQQPQTLEQIVTAARNGDLPSINLMGNMHKVGNTNFGMPVNIAEAKAWFEIGASKGYAPSMFNLGLFYENGAAGIPKDIEKARAYYAQAAKLGFTRAQERLAALPPKAVATTAPAPANALQALNGNWYSAQWKYGYTLQNGVGTATSTNSPNFQVGQNILQLAPTAPNKFSGQQVYTDGKFYNVTATLQPDGSLYFEGDKNVKWTMNRNSDQITTDSKLSQQSASNQNTSTVLKTKPIPGTRYEALQESNNQNYSRALAIHLYLAAQNNKDAIRDAAKILTYGQYGAEKNVNEAIRLYKNLADAGDWISMRSLYDIYTSADLGFSKNEKLTMSAFEYYKKNKNNLGMVRVANYLHMKRAYAEAFQWALIAAESGDADAQNFVGSYYAFGAPDTVKEDKIESFKWYKKSADQNNPRGQYVVAILYEQGLGTQKDEPEAIKWFKLAAAQGHEASITELRRLTNQNIQSAGQMQEDIAYKYNKDGNCKPSSKVVCLTPDEYKNVCSLAKSVTKNSIQLQEMYLNKKEKILLLEVGNFDSIQVIWTTTTSGLEQCWAKVKASGIVGGNSASAEVSGVALNFIKNPKGEILVDWFPVYLP